MDPSSDVDFYASPRFVTHIDDQAIIALKQYYDANLPLESSQTSTEPIRILDVCSSWISHYPPRIVRAASMTESPSTSTPTSNIIIIGTGLNAAELSANPILNPTPDGKRLDTSSSPPTQRWWVQDLNTNPTLNIPTSLSTTTPKFDAITLTVSIDYLTSPLLVLASLHTHTLQNGRIHLAISNRCFPTKAVSRWLRIGEDERLEMVGDYLWWSGWRDVEIVTVVESGGWKDPLWVVRARKVGGEEGAKDQL
jgi:hypothetical protein